MHTPDGKALLDRCNELELRLDETIQEMQYYKNIASVAGHKRLKEVEELSNLIFLRKQAEKALEKTRDELEDKVKERTRELVSINKRLRKEIEERKKVEEEIRYLAFYDSLTGLGNRVLFMDRLNEAIKQAARKRSRFALLFLDLDHFKRVNDTLGHHAGDLLLQGVAENIKKFVRDSDFASRLTPLKKKELLVARFGGDEFSILISDIKEPENAARVAKRILDNIPATYQLDGHEVSVTTSIGISVFPEDGSSAQDLLKHADTAMYHAKSRGRNTYQFFTESMNQIVLERFLIEKGLKKALENDEFILYYQPKLRLSDKKIISAEALIRWHHPQQGMVPPGKFIPIAEESKIILDINRWVIKEACRQVKQWELSGWNDISISVNLSGYKLNNQNIAKYLKDTLSSVGLDSKSIEIEITENILLKENKETISTLNAIKALGFKIAMDDFGTGYSSLSYLTLFPLDTLKIDRYFVMNAMSEQNNQVIIKAIIAMGHSLGKKIIAEGIETEDQYHFLKVCGCDEGQGNFFHHPVPADEFEKLLARDSL
ncbi:EAL domain-containing protein [uncultured Desulfobacter sp.]|uniref:putative bifunctional diguanylate cyclase/phosphodiesterase n=1 Tax=uncultured Desulfobacter sp. TaxID=240139 RepID=UPI0029F4B839|nr:EAL domain-containing protein [uncultured Desulfobacter sp.]